MKNRTYRASVYVLSFLIIVFAAGCDSQSSEESDGPDPLSVDVFSIETDLFEELGSKSGKSKFNFLGAAIRVWPVSIILRAHTVIPIAVTQAAFQSTPTFSDGVWTWSKTIVSGGQSFQFVLTGEPDGSNTDWTMFISSDNPYLGQSYDDFELFNGRTATDGSSGQWQLYYLVDGEPVNVLNASFNHPEADLKQLTFQIPETAAEHGGDSVFYQVDDLTRGFFWTQVNKGIVHDIVWNSFTNEGSIRATNHLDGSKGCWDKYFDDVGCSS